VQFSPVDLLLALMAIGGLLAATGAFMFIAIAVVSVFFGQPLGELTPGVAVAGVPQGLTNPPVHAADVDRRADELQATRSIWGPAPGTMALVFVFLGAFVVYFFVNWKVLSFVWKIGWPDDGSCGGRVGGTGGGVGDHGRVVGARASAARPPGTGVARPDPRFASRPRRAAPCRRLAAADR
jgi:hypothetical protein